MCKILWVIQFRWYSVSLSSQIKATSLNLFWTDSFNSMTTQHVYLMFTSEPKIYGRFLFLECNGQRHSYIVYQISYKHTFTGLYMVFFSFVPCNLRLNIIVDLFHKTFPLSSESDSPQNEFTFLTFYFIISWIANTCVLFGANWTPSAYWKMSIIRLLTAITFYPLRDLNESQKAKAHVV